MQDPSSKRPFKLMIDSNEGPLAEVYFPSPRKKVKKALSIEILDSFADSPILNSKFHLLPQNSPFLAHKLADLSIISPQDNKNTPSSRSIFSKNRFSFKFEVENESLWKSNKMDRTYDDFYQEGAYYDVTMRKCHRKTMEDRTVIEPELLGSRLNDRFFGIYDGHSSTNVSEYLQQNFHKMVASHPCFIEEPKRALKEAFEQIDEKVLESNELKGGSTALCALIRDKKLYLANAGDSKAVLIRKNEIKDITREHRASNEEERVRVESHGGVIIVHKSRNLVQGSLQITRSIGDKKYKKYISCEPDVFEYDITNDDQMIIMASDGFWDNMNNEEVMEIVKSNCPQFNGLSKLLVESAMQKRSHGVDNISLMVIHLSELAELE